MKREIKQRKVTFTDSVQIEKTAIGTVIFEIAHIKLDQNRLKKLEKLFNETLKKVERELK